MSFAPSTPLDVVLVAPDLSPFVDLVASLRVENHRIWEMRDCGAALAFLLDNEADVAVIDSGLRGLRGLEIVPLVRKIQPRIQIVAVVDESSVEQLRQVLSFGISYHTLKPFDGDRVLEAISQLQRRSGRKNGL